MLLSTYIYISYIVAVSFIGGGIWSTQNKTVDFITESCIMYTSLIDRIIFPT